MSDVSAQVLKEMAALDGEYEARQSFGGLPRTSDPGDYGNYLCEIKKAEPTKTPQSGNNVIRLLLYAHSGPLAGYLIDHSYFVDEATGTARLGGDLVLLGFDADKWTAAHKRRFSVELAKHLPQLVGLCFQAKKELSKAKEEGGRQYVNFNIGGLVKRPTGPPQQTAAPAAPKPPNSARAFDVPASSDIPFAWLLPLSLLCGSIAALMA